MPVFHIAGYELAGTRGQIIDKEIPEELESLIVLIQDSDDSPGPCANTYTLVNADSDVRALAKIPVADPSNIQKFELSIERIASGLREQEDCIKELNL
ncbi:hypothetical protein ACFL21_02080 [Patescibacteria group bacterium]